MELKEIYESFRDEDNVALDHIYVEFGGYCVRNLVRKGCTKENAEDLFIEAVMTFREKVLNRRVVTLTNTRQYLYRIAMNLFLTEYRKKKSYQQKESEIRSEYYSNDFGPNEGIKEEMMSIANRALEMMSDKCKRLITYFYIDELDMAAIAEVMGFANANVAKTSKSRCFGKLVSIAKGLKVKDYEETI